MNEPRAELSFGVAFGRVMLFVGVISAILGAAGLTRFWMLAGYAHLIALVLFITHRPPGAPSVRDDPVGQPTGGAASGHSGKRQTVEATETKVPRPIEFKIPRLVPPWAQK